MNRPHLIVAGDHRQARHLAKFDMRLNDDEWRYIGQNTTEWLSYYGASIWAYGTYYTRRDWCEIQAQCRARGIIILRIEEVRL